MTLLESNTGGSGTYARGLLRALHDRGDLEVDELSSRRSGGPATLSWMLLGARQAASSSHVDLLHAPGFLIPYRPTTPLVITIHDLALAKMPQGHPLEWRLYYEYVFPRLARSASAIITPTDATRRDVLAELNVDSSRVTVTPYGIADAYFNQTTEMRPTASPPVILFAGPPIKRKNLDAVLQVMADAPDETAVRSARLKITGAAAADYPEYDVWIRTHGLQNRVDWLGLVPASDLPALYSSASVFAYPSFLEGFGFPPLEAMAVGTPVVASSVSCLPEVLGEAAVLVDPRDYRGLLEALESVLTNPSLRVRLASTGREWARRYTWKRCAELTVAVYRSVSDAG